jgi:hypothetical protein
MTVLLNSLHWHDKALELDRDKTNSTLPCLFFCSLKQESLSRSLDARIRKTTRQWDRTARDQPRPPHSAARPRAPPPPPTTDPKPNVRAVIGAPLHVRSTSPSSPPHATSVRRAHLHRPAASPHRPHATATAQPTSVRRAHGRRHASRARGTSF